MYFESARDSTSATWALVKIKDGEAVLQDVTIDGISIHEIAGDNKTEYMFDHKSGFSNLSGFPHF